MLNLGLDVVTTAAILFIVSAGLLMVFGVMKIINFSHGAFLTTGGYASVIVAHAGLNWWWGVPCALAIGFVAGMAVERFIVRPLYARPLDAILATWGLGIIVSQIITLIFGRGVQMVASPVDGAISLAGAHYSAYRLILVGVAVLIALALGWLLNGTRLGLQTRAVIMNEALARGLGISSSRVRFMTFSTGAALASAAGCLITPLASVDPNMGVPWIVGAFMLVLVSGSSLVSLAVASVVLGGAQVLVSTFVNPVLGGLTIAVLAALLLRIRPEGFARG
ncbi:branched-chain amino acid transport system permease protein [Paraburkholderia silvatlantica]|uniref:Amino acid/amide ABC transporter membrane protein 1 (HAAT family) n=1 Tax=Paraburkholderia silvatlantica TaxID=321895 RepID=A0A2U1AA45_9BURK|nr:branched-chain amino acid transport system permease protein [Paraburkholderia silvatlantica]PVY31039.1 amino acid/amide ABC transporter membrane protein 1 (HAAT family) [Paraburkholderia silvatlantica]PXW37175.1 amino acid/amide ABC transporter membrane protein 1 (HAAT family) [Paraburkholderia silvatlantica]PYE19685.1 amino acid/amide ABC transporter membrane protein 1 (HAAT family) [Paraburkholderia silvatlantica]TDQ89482.1 amino acid/amide ABC transporter membrane protein 1 (HAAT family) 